MTVATLPHPTLDLQAGDAAELAGGAFPVDCVVDHQADDNTGLIPAVAALLIDLHRKRLAREQVQQNERKKGTAA